MSSPIDFIRPKNLNEARILSWFTYKNIQFKVPGQKIPGLNFGFNTDENQEIVLGNLNTLTQEIGTNLSNVALAEQVHGTTVQVVTKGGVYPETDAFVSNKPGVSLGIQVADCGAILFGDSKNRVIGAAHAGWRGAVAGIIPNTILKMIELGAEREHINAFVSPCIAKHNFEVGEEVAVQFQDGLVEREAYKKPHVDLKGLIKSHLNQEGVLDKNIIIDERCTIDQEDLFYSYRREKNKSGRMVAIIKLTKLNQ